METKNERTIAALLASFYAASRIARNGAPMVLNAAAAAGLLLHMGGSTQEAIRLGEAMPVEEIWITAIKYLRDVEAEAEAERATRPELRIVGGGR